MFRELTPPAILALLVVDGLVFITSLYYGVALRYFIVAPHEYSEVIPVYPRAAAYTLIMLASFAVMGLYARAAKLGDRRYIVRFVSAFVIGALLMYVAGHFAHMLFLRRGSLALTVILAFALAAGARLIMQRYILDRGFFNRPG
jgi:FlaA1/EpsC-like NDP-sugar epimerase